MDKFSLVSLLILILVFAVVCGPLILIYGINTLGAAAVPGFVIPYTLDTWFASLLIGLMLGGGRISSRKYYQ